VPDIAVVILTVYTPVLLKITELILNDFKIVGGLPP
jgi:hypothetical protein